MTPRRARNDIADHHDRADMAEPMEKAEPIDHFEV
jgi:hypothetical protein